MLHIMHKSNKKIISMTLIITIFVIFAVSLATQFLVNISILNLTGTNQIILNKRAIQAAKSGIQWGLVNLIKNQECFNQTNLIFNQSGLNQLSVHLNCNATDTAYQIYSQAIYGTFGNNNYVNKIINVEYPKASIANLNPNH